MPTSTPHAIKLGTPSKAGPLSDSLGVPVTADAFKSLFRGHPGGIAVITAEGPDGPVAMTASSVASVSADPPVLIFSTSALSSATPAILRAETLVVHLLDADDLDLAKLASTSGADRFANPDTWFRLSSGEPVYRGVRAWMRGQVVNRMEVGGSTILAVEGLSCEILRAADGAGALAYHNRTWHRLGEHSRLL